MTIRAVVFDLDQAAADELLSDMSLFRLLREPENELQDRNP